MATGETESGCCVAHSHLVCYPPRPRQCLSPLLHLPLLSSDDSCWVLRWCSALRSPGARSEEAHCEPHSQALSQLHLVREQHKPSTMYTCMCSICVHCVYFLGHGLLNIRTTVCTCMCVWLNLYSCQVYWCDATCCQVTPFSEYELVNIVNMSLLNIVKVTNASLAWVRERV